jgi:hypothetical protein
MGLAAPQVCWARVAFALAPMAESEDWQGNVRPGAKTGAVYGQAFFCSLTRKPSLRRRLQSFGQIAVSPPATWPRPSIRLANFPLQVEAIVVPEPATACELPAFPKTYTPCWIDEAGRNTPVDLAFLTALARTGIALGRQTGAGAKICKRMDQAAAGHVYVGRRLCNVGKRAEQRRIGGQEIIGMGRADTFLELDRRS